VMRNRYANIIDKRENAEVIAQCPFSIYCSHQYSVCKLAYSTSVLGLMICTATVSVSQRVSSVDSASTQLSYALRDAVQCTMASITSSPSSPRSEYCSLRSPNKTCDPEMDVIEVAVRLGYRYCRLRLGLGRTDLRLGLASTSTSTYYKY
jgi:hypothetical protein